MAGVLRDVELTPQDTLENAASPRLSTLPTLSPTYHDDQESDHSGDIEEPLLSRYRFKEANEASSADEHLSEDQARRRRRRRRLQGIAFLAGGTLMVVGLVSACTLALTRYRTGPAYTIVGGSTALALSALLNDSSNALLANEFLQEPASINQGVIPFSAGLYSPAYRRPPLLHTLSTSALASSPICLERLIATGQLCPEYEGKWNDPSTRPKLDVIWTWVNGSSEEPLAAWRQAAADQVEQSSRRQRLRRRAMNGLKRLYRRLGGAAILRHFREHDELRFSVRSVLASLGPSASLSTLHLVVADTPVLPSDELPAPSHALLRAAQIPHWLNLRSFALSEPATEPQQAPPRMLVHPHSELFKMQADQDESDAMRWQEKVLPSFNSLAIESQLANLPTSALTAVYLNDDFFLHRPLELADFASPLSGSVFRMQGDLLVRGVAPADTHDDPEGEWRGLGYTAWLLDQRFGQRGRPYLVHVAKSLDLPLLREVQQVFLDELTQTALARFRGRGAYEVQALFLLSHYIIEKHREALLWSFLVARSDADRSGTYDVTERRALLADLGYDVTSAGASEPRNVSRALRTTLANLPQQRELAGLAGPRETTLEFSSHDGYAFSGLEHFSDSPFYPSWPPAAVASTKSTSGNEPVCIFDWTTCFGDDFLSLTSEGTSSVSDAFTRIAFEHPQCGDCLIALLMEQSGGSGLEAFLPAAITSDGPSRSMDPQAVALEGNTWRDIDFSRGLEGLGNVSLRARCAALIHRYSYVIGASSAAFESIRSGGSVLSSKLDRISAAFVALNDDVFRPSETVLRDIDGRMGKWFQTTWPEQSPWELIETS